MGVCVFVGGWCWGRWVLPLGHLSFVILHLQETFYKNIPLLSPQTQVTYICRLGLFDPD